MHQGLNHKRYRPFDQKSSLVGKKGQCSRVRTGSSGLMGAERLRGPVGGSIKIVGEEREERGENEMEGR